MFEKSDCFFPLKKHIRVYIHIVKSVHSHFNIVNGFFLMIFVGHTVS